VTDVTEAVDHQHVTLLLRVTLDTGRVVCWRLPEPRPFRDVVLEIEELDATALLIQDAHTGAPRYLRLEHVVEIAPDTGMVV
jgi:hypothetical protein